MVSEQARSRDLPYSRGHGLGNDYIVVEQADLPFDGARLARAICDRHRGVGADGLLVSSAAGGRIVLHIFNPDGSVAEKSGNGLRIFGAYLYGRRVVGRDWFNVELIKDTVAMRIEEELAAGALQIRAVMGRGEVLGDRELPMNDGSVVHATAVSMSNPHSVTFVDQLERNDFLDRAPQICKHEQYPEGTNVQFARVRDRLNVDAWIWERGVGETQASGSSSCAIAAASLHHGYVDPGVITIHMPGGDAEIEISADYQIKLRAPAQIICEGRVRADVLAGW